MLDRALMMSVMLTNKEADSAKGSAKLLNPAILFQDVIFLS
jgi:hypothetical protein